jgi:transposase
MSDNILELQALVLQLVDRIALLELANSKLEAENIELNAQNSEIKAENAELKARLHLDSHNSSKPPSSDGLKKKPAFPKEKNAKQGGQKGHDGHTLEMVKKPDHIVICKPNICTCGQDLCQQPMSIVARRQLFDLPVPRLEVIEYQLAQICCPVCGQSHIGEFPSNIKAPTQYGTGVKALVTLLNSEFKLPFQKIQTLFGDLFGYAINVGTIIAANAICYDKLADTEALIQEKITSSSVVNSDESGVRCTGKLHWLHVASTSLFTYLFVHQKRGKEAIESDTSILNRFFGWLVHDCWSSYFNLTHLKHAVCGAHLLRELQALIENQSQWAISFKAFLLQTYNQPFEERLENRTEIEQQYDILLQQAQLEEPQPKKTGSKGRLKRTKGRNLLERLQKYKSAVLAFAFNEEVPFTNNQAERDIRPIKVKQKIAGCFRTFKGAEHYARIASFISTTRKHKLNVFKELCNLFEGNSFLTLDQPAK